MTGYDSPIARFNQRVWINYQRGNDLSDIARAFGITTEHVLRIILARELESAAHQRNELAARIVELESTPHWPWRNYNPRPGAWTIEPHADGYALYDGEDDQHHGARLCNISDADGSRDAVFSLIEQAPTLAARVAELEASIEDLRPAVVAEDQAPPIDLAAALAASLESAADYTGGYVAKVGAEYCIDGNYDLKRAAELFLARVKDGGP